MVASSSFILLNGSFFIRGPHGSVLRHDLGQHRRSGGGAGPYRARALRQPELARLHLLGVDWRSRRLLGHACCATRASSPASASPRGFGYERSRDRATPATLDPTAAFFVGPAPDIQAWGGGLSVMHVPVRLVRPGSLRVSGLQCAGPRRQRLLGLRGWRHQEGHHALVDPGRYLQELVRHRQHRALRRVRQGDGLWCRAAAASQLLAANSR